MAKNQTEFKIRQKEAQITIEYTFRGNIERPTKSGSYQWYDGYSTTGENGEVRYPWMTKKECREEAKKSGAKAVFIEK